MSCSIDTCDVIEMIAGSKKTMSFKLYNEANNLFNMGSYEARFSLSYAPNRSMAPVLVKEMDKIVDDKGKSTGEIKLTLESEDTYLLNGKYIYQIVIYNADLKQADVSHQGEMLIYENIDKAFFAQLRKGE